MDVSQDNSTSCMCVCVVHHMVPKITGLLYFLHFTWKKMSVNKKHGSTVCAKLLARIEATNF